STYWAAGAMAFTPEGQTLLTGGAGTVMGTPPRTAACLAVIWPCPAWSTWPMTTCSTSPGSAPARSRAALMARPPSSTAGSEASAPPKRPMGVLAPAQMTGWVRSNMAVPPSPALAPSLPPGVPPARRDDGRELHGAGDPLEPDRPDVLEAGGLGRRGRHDLGRHQDLAGPGLVHDAGGHVDDPAVAVAVPEPDRPRRDA